MGRRAKKKSFNDIATRNRLVTENLGLARTVARRFFAKYDGYATLDDFEQSARIGLMRAADLFDPSRGFKFSTLAYRLCWQRCLASIRSKRIDAKRGIEC